MLAKQIPLFDQLLKDGKENGNLNIYACSLAMDIMGWEKEDMVDIFKDIIGVTKFLGIAQGVQVITM